MSGAEQALDLELRVLFGRRIYSISKTLKPADLIAEAELVAEGARQLRQLNNQPTAQRQVVMAMSDETAAALCRWLKEPELARQNL